MNKKALIISGPTASGKSDLAMQIANFTGVSIINADSLQIYQGLPILSAQPSKEEMSQVKHYLYSKLSFNEQCSVGLWLNLAKEAINESFAQNKLPIIVGGSGMYISKLVDGISKIPEITPESREESCQLYDKMGHEAFQKNLYDLTGEKIIDKQRLTRAYEVFLQTKKPISHWRNQPNEKVLPDVEFLHINLNPNREKLYENCNLRFEKMLKNGAISEVKKLINKKITPEDQITKTLGFYEIRDLIRNKISQEEAIESASQKTRNYAKRQLTYFRNQLRHKHVFEKSKEALDFLVMEGFL